ncbi:MAG: phosphoribosylanthranilate isomerase [Verrucomicrobiaceae bacterium]|nr:phosphoribosylanthranilate isomerase [Verrucomicrobiaceae bacterium]
MFPPTGRIGIKICGFKDPAQVQQVLDLGADAIGINLWPQSKRHMPLEQAQTSLATISPHHHLVAVLVNPDDALLDATIRSGLFRSLQLHGDESPALVASLIQRGQNVIKAFQVRDAASLDQIAAFPCTDILLDAYNPGLYGGGGHAFPWELAVRAAEQFPDKRIILSGGLTPATVAQAVIQTHPAAVDVASGVESAPGIKDLALVADFLRASRM